MVKAACEKKIGRVLTHGEVAVIYGAFHDLTYSQVSKLDWVSPAESTLRKRIAPALWEAISTSFGEPVGKKSFASTVKRLLYSNTYGLPDDTSPFYGREEDTVKLRKLVTTAKVVTLVGVDGIGKKSLALHTARTGIPEFQSLGWISMYEIEPNEASFLKKISDMFGVEIPGKEAGALGKTLVIVEAAQMMLDDEAKSTIKAEFQRMMIRLQRTEVSLLLISNEPFPLSSLFLSGNAYEYVLSGLSVDAAKEIFKEEKLKDTDLWEDVIASVGGHPQMMRIFARYCRETFQGKIPSEFSRLTIKLSVFKSVFDFIFRSLDAHDKKLLIEIAESENTPKVIKFLENYSSQEIDRLVRLSLIGIKKEGEIGMTDIVRKYILDNSFGLVNKV